MRQAIIFSLLASTLISSAPAVAQESKERAQIARRPPFDWVLVDGDGNNHMSGSMENVKRARALRQGDEKFLYIKRDGRTWLIRDAAVLERVRAAWAPAEEHGRKMSAVGAKMSVIGDKMGLIGTKMGQVGVEMARQALDDGRRQKLQATMDALQREMDPLQAEMAPYQEQMEQLGKVMERLSANAQEEMTKIVEAALAQGLGREVK